MERANYFHDGYTQDGYIEAVSRVHGSLRFGYRPALVEERSRLLDVARRLKADAYDRHAAAFAAPKLVWWDLTDAMGNEVSIAPETLLRLQPDLFVKLHRIVAGWLATDLDPRWAEETRARALDDEITSVLSGQAVGDVRQEGDEKNWQGG